MRQIFIIIIIFSIIITGCTVQKTSTVKGGCDDSKVIKNEKVGISYESSKSFLYGITLDNQSVIAPATNVIILDANDKLITGVISGSFGEFQIQLEPGLYQIRFNKVGYCDLIIKDVQIAKGEIREVSVGIASKATH